jgi:hypothetical protein
MPARDSAGPVLNYRRVDPHSDGGVGSTQPSTTRKEAMQPADYPIEFNDHLEKHLRHLAYQEHQAARLATKDVDTALAHGHAEAAFAYACAAAETSHVKLAILAHLDREAAKEAQAEVNSHTWPIAGLVNVDEELGDPRPGDMKLQWPHWGIPVEGTEDNAHLAVAPSTRGTDEILLFVHDIPNGDPFDYPSGHLLNVDIDCWRALNRLVERIAAGQPIPHNEAGVVFAPPGK